jgi:hypothetical protein
VSVKVRRAGPAAGSRPGIVNMSTAEREGS